MRVNRPFITACACTLFTASGAAWALPVPDSGSANCGPATTPCLKITNTSSTANVAAVVGVATSATGATGVSGQAGTNGYGVYGEATGTTGAGVYGFSPTTNGRGVIGHTTNGTGVLGLTTAGTGVYGSATTGSGMYAIATSGVGAYANSVSGDGLRATSAGASGKAVNASNTGGGWAGYFNGTLEVVGNAFKPGGGSWSASSDLRIKKDVRDFAQGLTELEKVRVVAYKYNGLGDSADDGKEYVGVIAQELEKVLPGMVSSKKAKLNRTDAAATDIKVVDPSNFTYLLINTAKAQQRKIESLEARLAKLEGRRPTMASLLPTGTGAALMLGLVPLGVVLGVRARKRRG
jgi:hypothetical protein